ncbi:MAG: DegT/DnrJ/EryC1/StrS family aminotransferase, partial [Deltaproteobacteria bacterium]|nr:DegT/DnrJ/EryC1/StrS family aminotransferase [Deltaproteobacteria bacterium]
GKPLFDSARHRKWPIVTEDDRRAVMRVLERGVLSGSDAPEARALQEEFAQAHGARHALLTHSGTSALQLSLAALGIGEGDEVIVPAYSFVATPLSVLLQGAVPIFVDVSPESGLMDPHAIEAVISPRTKAIMPVHVHGCPCDLEEIQAIAKRHGLLLIEDAAQAHLATYRGRFVGTFGHGGAFSLQSSKNLSAGEGGIYLTNDSDALERANQVRNFGQDIRRSDGEHYRIERPLDGHRSLLSLGIGSMYRGNEMMAAFARSQLRRLPDLTNGVRSKAARLSEALKALPGVFPPALPKDRSPVFHKYRVRLDPQLAGLDLSHRELRDAMIAALRAEGCEVVLWQSEPLPHHPLFQKMVGFGKGFPFFQKDASQSDGERIQENYRASYPGVRSLLDGSIVLFSQSCPLIAQDDEVVELYIQAFYKVWEQRHRLVDLVKKGGAPQKQ